MTIVLTTDWDSEAVLAIAKKMPTDKARKWETHAGRMFFKHRRASYHLRSINKSYQEMIAAMQPVTDIKHAEEIVNSSYSGPLSEVMLFHLDGFFEAERSSHDCVLTCLRTANVLTEAPSSMRKFYEQSMHKPALYPTDPPDVKATLKSFWEVTGKRTKAYRDCFNHYVSLSGPTWQHAVNMQWANGLWKPLFLLPDNPESRSYDAFKFDNRLDALDVSTHIHGMTTALLKSVIAACLSKWQAAVHDKSTAQLTVRNVRIGD